MPQPPDPPGGSRRSALTFAVVTVLFLLFTAGGLFFGYIFLTTLLSLLGEPERAQLAAAPGEAIRAVGQIIPPAVKEPASLLPGGPPVPTLPDFTGRERVNILLLGVDQRPDERAQGLPSRSDTMIILTLEPQTRSAGLLSIPRDLWVPIPGHGENKINTAHFFGDLDRPGGGPALAKRTVELNFGVRIHYFARVDFRGFEKLIDTLGGITLDVERPIKDDEYPTEDYGIRRIFIPAGLQRMDGVTALWYARSRHSENDFGRMRRQQQVILAAQREALRLDLDLLRRLPQLLATVRETITTDIPPDQILALASLARSIKSENVTARTIDASMVIDVNGDGTVLIPNRQRIRQVIQELFFDPQLKTEAARIAVLNGTQRAGLAAATAEALRAQGYLVVRVDQAPEPVRRTTILSHTAKPYTVQRLAALLKVPAASIQNGSADDAADITIILGPDAQIPPP